MFGFFGSSKKDKPKAKTNSGTARRKSRVAQKNKAKTVAKPKTALDKNTQKKTSTDGKTASYKNPNRRAQASSTVTGKVKTKGGTYKTYKKDSSAARSFRSAFDSAKKAGYKTFTWEGKRYNTKTK